jgi:hypothetical protein
MRPPRLSYNEIARLAGAQSTQGQTGAIEPRCCDSKIAKLRASLTPSLRLDHNKISCWYRYGPFQPMRNKFKRDLRI